MINLKRKLPVLMLAAAMPLIGLSCNNTRVENRNRVNENQFPQTILWVWERPEDLEFLDPQQFAVAFLAQTLVLKGDEVVFKPRHQPLKVRPEVKVIAVTRIETEKTTALSATQREKLVEIVLRTRELKNVSALQIDFDATTSQREFYRTLLHELRQRLPDNVPLSMTALASFFVGDRWLQDLPVDEAIPMIYRMGKDDQTIKWFLESGKDFKEPICAKSYLGKQAIEWAKTSPNDPRIPEVLFIAARANKIYKYGCNGWEQDEKTKEEAETLLREQYPENPWTAKLSQPQNYVDATKGTKSQMKNLFCAFSWL